jgi:hypothetical protein
MICFSLSYAAALLLTSLCSSGSVCFQASGNIMPWPTATPNTGRACNVGRQISNQWPRVPKERSFKILLAKCGHWILNSGACLELLWQQEQTTAEVLWNKKQTQTWCEREKPGTWALGPCWTIRGQQSIFYPPSYPQSNKLLVVHWGVGWWTALGWINK